jgi:hypothetical protein
MSRLGVHKFGDTRIDGYRFHGYYVLAGKIRERWYSPAVWRRVGQYRNAYAAQHRKVMRAYHKQYRAEHYVAHPKVVQTPERRLQRHAELLAYWRTYNATHRSAISTKKHAYHLTHRAARATYMQGYHSAHPDIARSTITTRLARSRKTQSR